jgi:predicted RNA-binding Zn-ribbon protein involved in translation (DUF1610 family)
MTRTATQHGHDLLRQGFTVSQVVHDYGDICQTITELALEESAPISIDDVRLLHRCFDDAIASAVTEYGRERDQPNAAQARARSERIAALGRELRSSINTARLALRVIKSGSVGLAGSTGTVIDRTLLDANDLIDRLVEVFDAQINGWPHHIVVRDSGRRVSGVPDRRRSRRGGRRLEDVQFSSPPVVIPCPMCQTGMAGMLASSRQGARGTATYRCRDCGHQFDRSAES